jgi:hypothetical protein
MSDAEYGSWEKDLNFFPLSGFPRTEVQNLDLILMERGTGLEPATLNFGKTMTRVYAGTEPSTAIQRTGDLVYGGLLQSIGVVGKTLVKTWGYQHKR